MSSLPLIPTKVGYFRNCLFDSLKKQPLLLEKVFWPICTIYGVNISLSRACAEQFFISSFISLEVSLSEDNFLHNKRLHKRVTAIAQWIRLNLQSCGPGFECQAKHLCFRLYDGDLNAVGWGEGP